MKLVEWKARSKKYNELNACKKLNDSSLHYCARSIVLFYLHLRKYIILQQSTTNKVLQQKYLRKKIN